MPRYDDIKTIVIHGRRVSEQTPDVCFPGAEIWGMAGVGIKEWEGEPGGWHRWFDPHPVERTDFHMGIKRKRPEAWAWYKTLDRSRPLYLLEAHHEVPASVALPREQLQHHPPFMVNGAPCMQFTTTVDWMIAMALMEGAKRIILDGVGVHPEPEWIYTHRGIMYWIAFARGMGVSVLTEHAPCAFSPPSKLYGYERGGHKLDRESAMNIRGMSRREELRAYRRQHRKDR